MALSTLLERRHLVQAYTWQGVPLTTALTRFTLGFQARLERLWEWETLIPKVTPLPQKSHFAISLHLPSEWSLNGLRLSQALWYHIKHFKKKQALFYKKSDFLSAPGTAAINCCLPAGSAANALRTLGGEPTSFGPLDRCCPDKLLFSGFAELTIDNWKLTIIVSLRDEPEIKTQYFQHKYFIIIPKGFLNCQLSIVNC